MQPRIARKLGAVALTCAAIPMASSAAANTEDAAAHNAARQALASQNYFAVIGAYEGIYHLTPIAKYRLAIAHSRTGDPVKAYALLQEALAADPRGSFASSAQRLQSFTDSLVMACEEMGVPGCQKPTAKPLQLSHEAAPVRAPVRDTPTDAVAEVVNNTAASPTSAATSTAGTPEQPESAVATVLAPAATTATSGGEASEAAVLPGFDLNGVGYLWVALAFAILAGTAIAFKLRKIKSPSALDSLPPEQAKEVVDIFISLQTLHSAAQTQLRLLPPSCALAQSLRNLMPHLEQEFGRAFLAKNGDPSHLTASDSAARAVRDRFKGRPILVADASPEEVAALFQSARWD